MQFRSAFTAAATTTTAIIFGLSKRSNGLLQISRTTRATRTTTTNQFVTRFSSSNTMTTTTTPDVSKFMSGERPSETKDYIMQQTMYRVKDPVKSLEFYCNVLGFKLVMYSEFPQWGFNVYFVAPVESSTIPQGIDNEAARWEYCMKLPGCLELTFNYGSQDQDGLVYNTGNADTTGVSDGAKIKGGFGHIGITVPDVYEACERFKKLGCTLTKTPNSGGMKGLAFMKDPDGYLIEILPQGEMITKPIDCDGITVDGDGSGYKDNSK